MKNHLSLLSSSGLAGCLALALGCASQSHYAGKTPTDPDVYGLQKRVHTLDKFQIKNLQDETLGRVVDLGIDLVDGRIVVVLVAVDASLGVGQKIISVPPLALLPDVSDEVYRLNTTAETFKTAPAIDLSKWIDTGRSDRVAAAYRRFGQEPYFLETGEAANPNSPRPKKALGYVERSAKILNMPVGNYLKQHFGTVWSMVLDIPEGRINSVIVLSPGNLRTKSVIPARALSFNAARDALLLDDTRLEYADEPHYVFTAAKRGVNASSKEESYTGPHTSVGLEQGTNYRDVDRTVRINADIRAANLGARNVQVGTINGRVTLRGWVNTAEEKRLIGDLAIAASRLELVDNQLLVGASPGQK